MIHLIHAALLWALILLVALDALDTHMILIHGGREINPFLKPLIVKMGEIPALLMTHGVLIAVLLYFRTTITVHLLVFFVIIFALIAYHNLVSWVRAGHGA